MLNKFICILEIPGAGPDVLDLHTGIDSWHGPIQVSPSASSETIQLANDFANILSQMGGPISVVTGQIAPGIMFGLFSECGPLFGQSQGTAPSYLSNPTEDYVILTKHNFIKILAKDHISLDKAMWKFCYLLNYRMLMPTDTWEIIPQLGNIKLKISINESYPLDFVNALGSSGGLYPEGQGRIEKWIRHNRLQNANTYSTGHAWQNIINENQDQFNLHPEYQGSNKKLCVLEEAVKNFAVQYAEDKIRKSPNAKIISLGISDGMTGWDSICQNTHEESLYNPSDRQILLANYVQEQLDTNPINRGVRLCIQAYGATSINPNININPRLVILVTDGFYLYGKNFDTVVNDYKSKGAIDIIPYSYLSIWTWSHGLPGQGKACNLTKIGTDISRIHSNTGSLHGTVLESCAMWGSSGIGYWITSQMLNDKRNTDPTILFNEFIKSAFPDVVIPMTIYYKLLTTPTPLTEDIIHRLYQCLRTAFDTTTLNDVKLRLIELGIYVRYLELYYLWKKTLHIDDFDNLASHIWRSRNYDVVATRLTFFDSTWTNYYDSLKTKYLGYTFTQFSNKPWTDKDLPFSEIEINTYIDNGLINNSLLNFIPKGFSEELIFQDRANDLRPRGNFIYSLNNHAWQLWMKPEQSALTVTLSGGKAYKNKGPGSFKIIEISTNESLIELPILVDQTITHNITLRGGIMYRVEITSTGGVSYSWPAGYCFTLLTDLNSSPFNGGYSGYFLIPAGTTVVGGYSKKAGTRILDPNGNVIYTTTQPNSYFNFNITASLLDQIYRAENMNGSFTMLASPPGMSFHPNELLIPKP